MEAKQNNKPFRQLRKVVMIDNTLSSEFPIMGVLVKVFFIKEKKSSYTIYTYFFYTEVNVSTEFLGSGCTENNACTEEHGSERFPEFPASSPGVGVTGVG